jgi:hypothetical protein
VAGFYYPDEYSLTRGGARLDTSIPLVGFQFQNDLNRVFFTSFEAYGAAGGGIAGYAKAVAALGVHGSYLTSRVRPYFRMGVGLAGGGGVDTGGGLVLQPTGGLEIDVKPGWSIRPGFGMTSAPDGKFSAVQWEMAIARSEFKPRPIAGKRHALLSTDDYRLVEKDIALVNKTYLPDDGLLNRSGLEYNSSLQLLGFIAEMPMTSVVSLTGSAYGAWYGDVGAYAEGLFGMAIQPWREGLRLHY